MASETKPHIAEIDFPKFYAPAFASLEASTAFYQNIADLPDGKKDAKVILHQAARMIWLADKINDVAAGRPAFQVLFYLTAAELVAKIVSGCEAEGESKKHVRKFFGEICSAEHRHRLSNAFRYIPGSYLSAENAVDFLYAVRCDVVHRGLYYTFSLRVGTVPILTGHGGNPPIAEISLGELRQIVLEGAVLAAQQIINKGSP